MDPTWLLAILAVVLVAWLGFGGRRPSAKSFLKQCLRELAVDPARLGEACLDDLVETAEYFGKTYAKDDPRRYSELVAQHIRDLARSVAAYLSGGKQPTSHDPIFEKLKRHGVVV